MGTTVLGSDFYYGYYGISIASFSGVFLTASANLADVASASNSRTNLGVPAIADIYTQTQLQTSGSASVHWANLSNNVWTKPAANIVAGYDVDINLHDITNVSTMYSTDITNSDVLTSNSILVSQWASGQNGSIITVNSSTGQLDRLQTIYFASSTLTITEDVDLLGAATQIGNSSGDILNLYSTTVASGSFSNYTTSGDTFFSQMTNDTLTDHRPAYFRHKSTLTTGTAIGLLVEHQTTSGIYSDDFGVGISFVGGKYPSTTNILGQINVVSTGSSENTGQMNFLVATGGSFGSSKMIIDYNGVKIRSTFKVSESGIGEDIYLYSVTGNPTHIVGNNASTSVVVDSLIVKAESDSSPGDGFGTAILFQTGQITPTETDIARISARFTGGTIDSEIVLSPMISEVPQEVMVIGAEDITLAANIGFINSNTYAIGSDSTRIYQVWTNAFYLGNPGNNVIVFNTTSAGFNLDVLPLTNDTYNLGDESSDLRWAEVHSIKVHVGGVISSSRSAGLTAKQNVADGFYAAVFESDSGENDDENGILIRSGSAVALAGNDVFIVFEDLGGNIVGGIRRNTGNTAFEFFHTDPWA